ncbi:MAG: energy transducer TonB [Geobacter sp.]|nr:energy transducer TonB [Geobacter sp.]
MLQEPGSFIPADPPRQTFLMFAVVSLCLHLAGAELFTFMEVKSILRHQAQIITIELREPERPLPERRAEVPSPPSSRRLSPPLARPVLKPQAVLPPASHPLPRPVPQVREKQAVIPAPATPSTSAAPAAAAQPAPAVRPVTTTAPLQTARPETPAQPTAAQTATARTASAAAHLRASAHSAYLAVIRGMIDQRKEYPLMARKGRMEGTVRVRFILGRDGGIRRTEVVQSSGRVLLDRATLQTISRIERFPPLPAAIEGNELSIEVPVSYRLDSR